MLFQISNLEYKLKQRSILSNQNINIENGKHLLILGPSGCGKTTLVNLMAGLLRPSNGEIIFEDNKFSNLSEKEIDTIRAKNFGFIFQKLHLLGHLNIEQNIALAQSKPEPLKIKKLINDLGLTSKSKQMAHDLSTGEAQRVAIARGVANNPKVIFADEPTSALDDINTKKVMSLIISQTKKNDSTLIVSTHDERIKKYFSSVIEISP